MSESKRSFATSGQVMAAMNKARRLGVTSAGLYFNLGCCSKKEVQRMITAADERARDMLIRLAQETSVDSDGELAKSFAQQVADALTGMPVAQVNSILGQTVLARSMIASRLRCPTVTFPKCRRIPSRVDASVLATEKQMQAIKRLVIDSIRFARLPESRFVLVRPADVVEVLNRFVSE